MTVKLHIYLNCAKPSVFSLYFSEGGEIFTPMQETFFAHRFAMLRDTFGTSCMIIKKRTPPQTN
jgi:uncharacterized glyoxalase superfamily protein PhnB